MREKIAALALMCFMMAGPVVSCISRNGALDQSWQRDLPDWDTSYGNSNFGHWIVDEAGLPAFEYTSDGEAIHWHQIGNDRIVAIGTNMGHVQVYSGEWGARWLNFYGKKARSYSGGFGYIKNEDSILSTFYPDKPDDSVFERIFGMGYYAKNVEAENLTINQSIYAPFGDDPILISQAKIRNDGAETVNLNYFEYWDINPRVIALEGILDLIPFDILSRFLNMFFLKETYYDNDLNAIISKQLIPIRLPIPLSNMPAIQDSSPNYIFLVALNAPVSGYDCDQFSFFGDGTRANPGSVRIGACKNSTVKLSTGLLSQKSCAVLQSDLSLKPGESKTLLYAYGYGNSKKEITPLIEKYRSRGEESFSSTMEAWKDTIPIFKTPVDLWLAREMAWDYYYLRSGATYDEFFRSHIISQGFAYQYMMGFQGAARDPCQHALPIVYTYPELAKEVIRYTMRETLFLPKGEIPYSIVDSGCPGVLPFFPGVSTYIPGDLDLWILWLTTEYVLATRDFAFLDEVIPYYLYLGKETVYEHLRASYDHLINVVGIGEHGLLKVRTNDWNDEIMSLELLKTPVAIFRGESVVETAMATYVLPYFAELCDKKGDAAFAREARAQAERFRQAVNEQWLGGWFSRLWLGDGTSIDDLMLEPQPWAIIGNVTTDDQAQILLNTIYTTLSTPIGSANSVTMQTHGPGETAMGGVWYALTGPLIWATSIHDEKLAWMEFCNNTLAKHAMVYPDIWYGVWSGPDYYNSYLSPREGETWKVDHGLGQVTERFIGGPLFPIMNMHSHAWPLYSAIKLSGIQPTKDGLIIDPKVPFEEFSLETYLLIINFTSDSVSGFYRSVGDDAIKIQVKLPSGLNGEVLVKVDGEEVDYTIDNGKVTFDLNAISGQSIPWEIEAH